MTLSDPDVYRVILYAEVPSLAGPGTSRQIEQAEETTIRVADEQSEQRFTVPLTAQELHAAVQRLRDG